MSILNTQKLISLVNQSNQQDFFDYLLNGEPLPHFANQEKYPELQREIEDLEMAGMSREDLIKATCFVIQNYQVASTRDNNYYFILKTPKVVITSEKTLHGYPELIKLQGVEYYSITGFNINLHGLTINLHGLTDFYSEILDEDYACFDI